MAVGFPHGTRSTFIAVRDTSLRRLVGSKIVFSFVALCRTSLLVLTRPLRLLNGAPGEASR